MGFKKNGPGCPCCCAWLISAIGCNSRRIGGCTIELWQSGVLIASATSSASEATRFAVAQGTYDVVITPISGTGFTTFTGSRTFACSTTDAILNCTLPIDTANFICGCAGAYPWPRVLHGTDFNGPITLTYGLGGVTYWRTPVLSANDTVVTNDGVCAPAAGTYNYGYSIMNCGGSQPILQVVWRIRCCGAETWKNSIPIAAIGAGSVLLGGTLVENPFQLTTPITGLAANGGPGCLNTFPGNGPIPPGTGTTITLTG